MRYRWRYLVFSVVLVAGCSRMPVEEAPEWQVDGRLVLTVDQRWQGLRFRAWQQGGWPQMELVAPMGQGRWRMGVDDDGPWLQDAGGRFMQGEQADAWLSRQLGFEVRLEYWFLLLRNRGSGWLSDAGWRLLVESGTQGPRCPRRLRLERAGVRADLLLKQWQGRCGP